MGASDPPPVNDNCGTGSNWRKACDFRDHDRGFATKGDAVMNRIHVAAAGMALAVTAVVIPVSAYAQAPITIEGERSEEHTSELQSLMRISYAVFCLKKK